MEFIKWYKNKIEENDLNPPENVWENIQDDLDVEQSWYFINKYLKKQRAVRRQSVFAMAASVIVLLSIGLFWITNPLKLDTENQSEITEVVKIEKQILDSVSVNSNDLDSKEIKRIITDTKRIIIKNNIDKKGENNYRAEVINDLTPVNIEINSGNNLRTIDLDFIGNSYSAQENKQPHQHAFTKLYIGSTGQLANTWLLNDKTYTGFESSSLTTSNASFGSNWGLFLGTNLTRNLDLQLDISVLAQNKQDYNEYLKGHYVSNTMKFNYSQLGFSIRYYHISRKFLQGEHGVNVGAYIGYLHSANQIVNGESLDLTDNYNNIDYGLYFGYEYLIPLSKNLGFGTGVRGYYGLQNIYRGDGNIPAYMNETKNASINISFSLKYSIK